MKSRITRFAAVRRFTGREPMKKSSMSIESETSTVRAMAMPSDFTSSKATIFCGRARVMMPAARLPATRPR